MTIDEQVNVEILRGQKRKWERSATRNFLVAGLSFTGAGVGIALSIIDILTKTTNNAAYTANNAARLVADLVNKENMHSYISNGPISTAADFFGIDFFGIALGVAAFGIGIYAGISGAMASHEEDKLAMRIAEIEKSPGYQARRTAQQS